MPIKYIELKTQEPSSSGNKTLTRKITVIDGQPYYLSTGENSGVKQWLPFIMMRGSDPRPFLLGIPDYYNLKNLTIYLETETHPSFLIKFDPKMLDPTKIILDTKHIEDKKFDLRTRLPTKQHVITSARLSAGNGGGEGYSEELLTNLGLEPEELKSAKQPIQLQHKPEYTFSMIYEDCDERIPYHIEQQMREEQSDTINLWLMEQKAAVATVVMSNYGRSCDYKRLKTIWDKVSNSLSPKDRLETLIVAQAKAILKDYTKGSCCGRFWSGAWNRNHIQAVNHVLSQHHNSLQGILDSLNDEIGKSRETIKVDGSLQKIIDFLKEQIHLREDKESSNTISAKKLA